MPKYLLLVTLLFTLGAGAEIKNSQNVLNGLLTRAGVRGMKPLSYAELKSLCEQGYTDAYFLYSGATETQVTCSRGTIRYQNSGDYRDSQIMGALMGKINSNLSNGGRIFVHCYNGAHASGFVAAVALRTFCGMSGNEAVRYWGNTLGGYPLQEPNRSKLMNRLRNYTVRTEFELSPNQKSQFGCP